MLTGSDGHVMSSRLASGGVTWRTGMRDASRGVGTARILIDMYAPSEDSSDDVELSSIEVEGDSVDVLELEVSLEPVYDELGGVSPYFDEHDEMQSFIESDE